jgi:hypothetical protein
MSGYLCPHHTGAEYGNLFENGYTDSSFTCFAVSKLSS